MPTTTELEEALRNGVILGRLGHFYAPEILPLRKIYDRDQAKYHVRLMETPTLVFSIKKFSIHTVVVCIHQLISPVILHRPKVYISSTLTTSTGGCVRWSILVYQR